MPIINIKNQYEDIDLGEGNKIRKYYSLDLNREINSEMSIISVQKSVLESLSGVLEKMGIHVDISKNMGRSGFTKITSKEFGQLGILATKGADSTKSFAKISDYYLGGTDIGDKVQTIGLNMYKIATISGQTLWKYKTELLLLYGLESLNRNLNKSPNLDFLKIDKIATKFESIITDESIRKLPKYFNKPIVEEVDSNSELVVQVLENFYPNDYIGAVEIVQSGRSLIATNNAIIQNGNLIMPSERNIETGEFNGKIISEINPNCMVGILAKNIQRDIDVNLYKIKNNKPDEFMKKIEKYMKNISKN